jgi:RNA polymerase sigma-70 factor (ECF subfamily)
MPKPEARAPVSHAIERRSSLSESSDATGSAILPGLYAEFREPLRRYALRLTRNPDRAEDLVQETFLRALMHFALLEVLEAKQRRAWLYRVLKNLFLDQQRRKAHLDAILQRLAQLAAVDDLPVVDVEVSRLIEAAPGQYRDVLFQRYIRGQTSDQIGDALGVPAATIRSRLRLAINWMKAHRDEIG